MSALTLQGIFREHYAAYAAGRTFSGRVQRAAEAIMRCRTPEMGGHIERCPHGHYERIQYHSCRHRSCTRCSSLPRAQWAQRQAGRLLDCDHYHVVFTLPHELLTLWECNRAPMARLLLSAARDTLMTLLKDPRFLGATPGLVLTLHTWGRTLSRHPHVHCLVSGGGLAPSGEWKAARGGYLLPVRVVRALFRGKLLAAIERGLSNNALHRPPALSALALARILTTLHGKKWNVCLKERYPHGRGVLRYLARYVKGGPIQESRLRTATATDIVFAYQDHRDHRHKTLRLDMDDFLTRVLWHVPAPRQHTVRHAGLYATAAAAKYATARRQLGQGEPACNHPAWQDTLAELGHADRLTCPHCHEQLVRGISLAPADCLNENSDIKGWQRPGRTRVAQQVVEVSTPTVPLPVDTHSPHADDIFLRCGVLLN